MNENTERFTTAVLAKNILDAKRPSFLASYIRIVQARRLLELIFSMLVIFGGQQFLFQHAFFSPIWPATGVALAAIFLRGNFLLLGIFLGSFTNYWYNHFPLLMAFAQSFIWLVIVYFTRLICLQMIGPISPLPRVSILMKWFLVIFVMCGLHTVIFFALLFKWFPWSWNYFFLGWVGQINGILCLVPLSLVFEPFVPQHFFNQNNRSWRIWGLLFILGNFLYFLIPPGAALISLSVLFSLLICYYAFCFGQIPTCITLFGLSIIYLGSISGPLALFHPDLPLYQTYLLSILLMLASLISLIIATYSQEKYYSKIEAIDTNAIRSIYTPGTIYKKSNSS